MMCIKMLSAYLIVVLSFKKIAIIGHFWNEYKEEYIVINIFFYASFCPENWERQSWPHQSN